MKKLIVYEICSGDFDMDEVTQDSFEYCRVDHNDKEYPVVITSIEEVTELPELLDDKYCLKFHLEYSKELDLKDVIMSIASNYENPFILVSPTEEQELIVDFTLDASNYYNILNSKNIMKLV